MRRVWLLALVPLLASACLFSDLERRTIDLDVLRAWAGQTAEVVPDSLAPAFVTISTRIPEIAGGSASSIEEVSLFVQIQNTALTTTEASVYAHREQIGDAATLRSEGVRILKPVTVAPQSAVQIDARNYAAFADGFDAFVELVLDGDFYLYILGEGASYRLNGNVPSLSFVVAID